MNKLVQKANCFASHIVFVSKENTLLGGVENPYPKVELENLYFDVASFDFDFENLDFEFKTLSFGQRNH